MEEIARFIKACIVDKTDVKAEVNALRARFQDVGYSFDAPPADGDASASADPIDIDLAGY